MPRLFSRPGGLLLLSIAAGAAAAGLVIAHRRRSRSDRSSQVRAPAGSNAIRWTSLSDSWCVVRDVLIPTIAMGPIIRRPTMTRRAEAHDHVERAVKTLQRMRDRYGPGPLMLRIPFRNQAVLLDGEDARRVLEASPDPFTPASSEKRAALGHFEPGVSLITRGPKRAPRRALNDGALEPECPVHHLSAALLAVIDEEATILFEELRDQAHRPLQWEQFKRTWMRVVRRVVFGDAARDDERIIEIMETLRSAGNWAWFGPRRPALRRELHARIERYIDRAEPGSLVAQLAAMLPSQEQCPAHQVPQWLFAFDPAGMTVFRALALLSTHAEALPRAMAEVAGGAVGQPHRAFLRATILETLRLWPTTPMILRQTTRPTVWPGGTMPAGTGVLVYAPLFHRDDRLLPHAHSFHPDLWMEDDRQVQGFPPQSAAFFPFSGGPAHCPGQNLVLMLTSAMLAALLHRAAFELIDPHRLPVGRLPGLLDHFTLQFRVMQRASSAVVPASSEAAPRCPHVIEPTGTDTAPRRP